MKEENMNNTFSKNMAHNFVTFYSTKSQSAFIGSILGFGLIGLNPAQAASLNNSTGISNPGTTITFSEIPLADGTPLTNEYSSLGVTFAGLLYNSSPFSAPNINSPTARNFSPVTNPFLISFAQLQTGAAFSLVTESLVSSNFEALFENTVVDSFNFETDSSDPNNFYGFTGVTFDAIRINAGNLAALIDNIQFNSAVTPTAVPEPFTIIGTLIGGTTALRMRKKMKAITE